MTPEQVEALATKAAQFYEDYNAGRIIMPVGSARRTYGVALVTALTPTIDAMLAEAWDAGEAEEFACREDATYNSQGNPYRGATP